MLVEDEEEQQPKEVVMKSVEQVNKDGHVIHHMDDRGNYLDKEGNVPLEMAPYPIPIRLPLSLSCFSTLASGETEKNQGLLGYCLILLLFPCSPVPSADTDHTQSNINETQILMQDVVGPD